MARRKKNSTDEQEVKIGQDGAALTDDAKKKLEGYVTEIERWEAEKAIIQADIGQIYNSAKDSGFSTKAIRTIIKQRKQTKAQREAEEALIDVYKLALGMLDGTPLGEAAIDAAKVKVKAA